ncbi:FadR/GntR family transcriptional regulator [Ammoniphilus resinae]|uniref:DNA-binding FadR family transcriptional regulator n=1 Tax=Ammoniphilus resinae TaxID=861532 RepID=A0ABS4GSK3_9BACL|nr:FadR/GntR family transcriptional regulator [Ammoniphilus resinae]MBP1933259.1 DNA-binding FadR family transcriptional regulator [Ammoniphilus resinae]
MDLNLSKTHKIIKMIQELIKERKLTTGERLPSERVLAELFQVNRSSIREAIQILTTLRMVETKVGSGVYIKDPNVEASIEWLYLQNSLGIGMNLQEIKDALEIRHVLEMYAIRKICLRQDDFGLRKFKKILNEQKAPNIDAKTANEIDRKFHLALAEASGNQLLVRLLNTLYDLSMDRRNKYFEDANRVKISFSHHEAIYNALNARDLTRAESLVALHVKEAQVVYGVENNF